MDFIFSGRGQSSSILLTRKGGPRIEEPWDWFHIYVLKSSRSGRTVKDNDHEENAYKQRENTGDLIPMQSYGNEASEIDGLMKYNIESRQSPQTVTDMANLLERIEEEVTKNQNDTERLETDESISKENINSSINATDLLKSKLESMVETAQSEYIPTVPPLASDHYPVINGGEDKNPTARIHRDKVKEMMKHAWDNYVRYAWGKNELRPLSLVGHYGSVFGSASMGATIVDALDTLYIMGFMDEFKQGRDWISENYTLDHPNLALSVFETNIRFVGGLLTCFALTGDIMFRDKAEYTAQKLLPAFETETGIPRARVYTMTGESYNYGWASEGDSILSEFGTLSLEFGYLSDITYNRVYSDKVDKIRQLVNKLEKPRNLYPVYLSPVTGEWGQHHVTMGPLGDSFFEYLLKEWLRSGRETQDARKMYDEAMEAVMTHMLRTSAGGLMYFSDFYLKTIEEKMSHLACFSGGMLALGSSTLQSPQSARYMEVAEGITHTCHESYVRTVTKLGPEVFRFSRSAEAVGVLPGEKQYILRPEVVESYFYLWRVTKDPKYREWGWEAVQALEEHCWTPGGYSGIEDVYDKDSLQDDVQQSFFLAETLKYLYLLFSDDSLISLDEWVFNTEAHPLPIKGVNPYYRVRPLA
ncbi:hypothetical protein J6590_018850 [Homalodisca vitripennis]|nr:hypothetical protein J6590_018850 [Homalodisca vitripennis]